MLCKRKNIYNTDLNKHAYPVDNLSQIGRYNDTSGVQCIHVYTVIRPTLHVNVHVYTCRAAFPMHRAQCEGHSTECPGQPSAAAEDWCRAGITSGPPCSPQTGAVLSEQVREFCFSKLL